MIPASESVKLLTSSLKGMKLSANEAISVVDKLTKLDMKSATSAQELAQALSKVANSARLAKVSQDEILGILSVGIETTQQSGDVIGTAVRSLLARFSNVKASKFGGSGEETEGTLNDTEAVLSKIGIRIRNASGEMRSFMDVLDDVAEKWDTLDDVSRNAISTAMAGSRQKEIFASIIENYDRVKELIDESANAAGTADEKYSAYMDSMEAATKRLQNAWEGFTQSLETSTVMKWLTNMSALLVENLDKFKYIITGIAAASSARIFDFFTNKGETGGFKGLIANIPFIGRGTKTNNILESIDKKVGNIEKGVGADSIANQTKNGGFFKRLGSFLKTGFGRGDIYDPETGKSISWEDYKKAKEFYKQYENIGGVNLKDWERTKQLLKQRQRGNAAMGAASAVITNALTTKQVGASGVGKLFNPTDQTVEETAGDKIRRTLASGALAAVGGYFLGPLGAMLGQTIGEGAASIVSTIIHRSELEMKQRVADAKENLSRLDAIKSTMESNNSIMTEELTSSEDFEKLYKYTDDLYEKLFDLQYEGNVDIVGAINDAYDTFEGVENITSIRDLCDEINNGNTNQRSMIKKQLELAEAQANLEELQKSQEERRSKNAEKIAENYEFTFSGGPEGNESLNKFLNMSGLTNELKDSETNTYSFKFSDDATPEDKINIFKNILSEYENIYAADGMSKQTYDSYVASIESYIKNIEEALEDNKKLDKELTEARSSIGFLAADIHDLTTTELKDLTMDGVVGRVVKSLEAQGVEVRNAAGYIKDEYQDAIEKLIKSDSKFNALQQADTKTLGQLTTAQEHFEEVTKDYIENWDEWYDRAQRGVLKDYVEGLELTAEELEKIIYAANPERIEQFARAWNTTTEGIKELTKEFPDLTTAIGLMSPSEVREYYSVFTDLFEDLATDSALTAENFEKLINQYPQLLKYYKQGGDDLRSTLVKKINEEQMAAYGNALTSTFLSSESFATDFIDKIKEGSFENFDENQKDTLISEIGSAKTLNEIMEKAISLQQSSNKEEQGRGKALEKYIQEYTNFTQEIEWTNPLYEKAKQAEIDYLQDEINNLEEQKNALSDVNDERQRELDLIKAKDALENAKQQKRRVYRAGIGFSYEADEEAISSAQQNLQSLDIQKQQNDLQYQIDQIELQKQILENLDADKQREINKQALEEWSGSEDLKKINGLSKETREELSEFCNANGMPELGENIKNGNVTVKDLKDLTDDQKKLFYGWIKDEGAQTAVKNIWNSEYTDMSKVVSALVDGYEKAALKFNIGKGEIYDAEGNVVASFGGIGSSESGKGALGGQNKTFTDASEGLTEAWKSFNSKYGKGGSNENWETNNAKGTQGYSKALAEYNEEYDKLGKALSAAESAGVSKDSNTNFENAQNVIKAGKKEDVPYKRIELKVENKDYGGGNKFDAREGYVYLNPQEERDSIKNSDDVYMKPRKNVVKKYTGNGNYSEWESWGTEENENKTADDLSSLPNYSIVANTYKTDTFQFVYDGLLYPIRNQNMDDIHYNPSSKFATGTLSTPEGVSLINELGTEAVITPGGTLTALPSKTGIVPADITKNVWALGEVAPTLVAQLGSLTQKTPTGNAGNTTYEEGQYFDNFTMNVYPAKGDDFNKILEQARAQMRLTRHNN